MPRWKRLIDLTCCVIALPFLTALTAFLAVVLTFLSPGPVIYTQRRIGRGGKPFTCYKFRTMMAGASTTSHEQHLKQLVKSNTPMGKLDRGDNRLIPGAWILRKSGLDELPQVINILRGEMSVVGPRPCLPYEFVSYRPNQMERFSVRPGLTGLWQVSGKNRLSFSEMVMLDTCYVRKCSALLDLAIIGRTIPSILLHD
jgi:lipopolysaccharide/colanic/teichoic acid biosynthesis glycosyltransferase